MKVPNYLHSNIVDSSGNITEEWEVLIGQILSELQINFSDEGLVSPSQSTTNIGIISPKAKNGTFLFDSLLKQPGVVIDGAWQSLDTGGGTVSSLEGIANQILLDPLIITSTGTIGLAPNAIMPGNAGIVVPVGADADRGTGTNGKFRYNSQRGVFEGYSGSWNAFDTGGGTVSLVNSGTGLTGGPITSSGTLSIANTTVAPGTYNYASFTVNAQGQLTSASSATLPIVTTDGGTGQSLYTDGQLLIGTTGGSLAKNTLTAGPGVTITNGSGSIIISATGTGGSVTSVAGDGTTITTSPNPITSTGTVSIAAGYVGQSSITTLGTIATGTWHGSIIGPTYGGTGINNGSNTLTLGGNLATSGAFASTFTMTGVTNVTFPTSGTLSTTTGTVTSISQGASIVCTPNPITTTGSINTIQNIRTSDSPTFTGLTVSGLTASQVVGTTAGSALTTLNFANANTANALVQRDGSGNFSAGTITAALTGNATTSTTATNATNVGITATTTYGTYYITFSGASTGNNPLNVYTNFSINPNTFEVTCPHLLPFAGNSLNLGSTSIYWSAQFVNRVLIGKFAYTDAFNVQDISNNTIFNIDNTTPVTTINSGLKIKRTPASGNYNILSTDLIVAYTSTSSAYTATLPTAASVGSGQTYTVVDESGAANTNNITINVSGGGNINGGTSILIQQAYGSLSFYSNGTQWFTR